jgi:hypothetical protein
MQRPPENFFQSLFDFSFSTFIAEKVIPILYILALIGIALFALGIIVSGFTAGVGQGLLALIIVAPLTVAFSVIYVRVVLEFLIVVFRIADNVRDIADQARSGR